MSDSIRLPLVIEDVTAAWLGEALSTRYPGVEVTRLTASEPFHGTATKLRLTLDYNEAGERAGLPRALCLKAGFGNLREFVASLGVYEAEAVFYRDVQPLVPVETPTCYLALATRNTQSVLLLEDLVERKVRFATATQPIGSEAAAEILDAHARLHAKWWGSPELDRLSCLRVRETATGNYSAKMFEPEVWAEQMARPTLAGVPVEYQDRERIQRAWSAYKAWGGGEVPRCFLHGDAHLGNMYFEPDGTPGFLDWQCVNAGAWSRDFAYFLISALDIPERRRSERDLLRHYLDRLSSYGANAPDFDDAWPAYQRDVMHGLFCWLVNPEDFQPQEVNATYAERFTTAATDLDTLKCLG